MPCFMAVKINYDTRSALPQHLKFSQLPTREEYDKFVERFGKKRQGGNGFHECLNFRVREDEPVRAYLPPTGRPAQELWDEEFVIFFLTYPTEKTCPSQIIGVQAAVRIVSDDGDSVQRPTEDSLEGVEPMVYHCEAPPDMVTLFTPPLPYDHTTGLFTPVYKRWDQGRRYPLQNHASAIISHAFEAATGRLGNADEAQRLVLERELQVLARIDSRYGLGALKPDAVVPGATPVRAAFGVPSGGQADKELGWLGEKHVFQEEQDLAEQLGCDKSVVQWVSQVVPDSPFDIQTVRRSPDGVIRAHYIEVKSSRFMDEGNVYVSERQLAFAKAQGDRACFALVSFDAQRSVQGREILSAEELLAAFEPVPIKYRLRRR